MGDLSTEDRTPPVSTSDPELVARQNKPKRQFTPVEQIIIAQVQALRTAGWSDEAIDKALNGVLDLSQIP